MAAYNAAPLIAATLDSIASQTIMPAEVIICDDGSSDETAAIIEAHPLEVTLIRRSNAGLATARNDAIEAATGDVIANIDADDLWHERFLERAIEAFEEHEEAPAVFTRYRPFMAEDELEPMVALDDGAPSGTTVLSLEAFLQFDRAGLPVLPSYFLFRRSVLDVLGQRPYVEGHRCGENIMVFPMIAAMGPVVRVEAKLGRYRIHAASITGAEVESARWMLRVSEEMIDRAIGLSFDAAAIRSIRRYAAQWSRSAGRRLGGAGAMRDGRAGLLQAFRQAHEPKTLMLYLASWLPGFASRVWTRAWRAEAAQR